MKHLAPSCHRHLLELFDDPVGDRDLEIELAAMIDAGQLFVSATYYLDATIAARELPLYLAIADGAVVESVEGKVRW